MELRCIEASWFVLGFRRFDRQVEWLVAWAGSGRRRQLDKHWQPLDNSVAFRLSEGISVRGACRSGPGN
ncbi:hypothetical protein B2J77_20960 [Pseudomonas parafulva]|uniref:Transposase n=1 Tax=Pseudomonas parafulva TaxID=157782 RepID=A0ABM6J7P9_9PSED|nr:hypothetical protein B2J77_20960 [Pseudomonas parafulva]